MTEMTPEELADCAKQVLVRDSRLHMGLIEFMASVGSALADVCSYGLVIGDSYVPFDPDEDECEDEEVDVSCEQAWVRVASVTPTGGVDTFGGMCGQEMSLALEVGVLRCLPVPEKGKAVSASDMLAATLQSMDDMNAMYRGAMGVEDDLFDSMTAGDWTPVGPLGGQYGGIWSFTVVL